MKWEDEQQLLFDSFLKEIEEVFSRANRAQALGAEGLMKLYKNTLSSIVATLKVSLLPHQFKKLMINLNNHINN